MCVCMSKGVCMHECMIVYLFVHVCLCIHVHTHTLQGRTWMTLLIVCFQHGLYMFEKIVMLNKES